MRGWWCRYMKRAHFPGWARPYEFNAQLYKRLGRNEEARDSARVALYTPWWTLRAGFQACANLAQFPGTSAEVRRIMDEVMKSSEGGPLPPGIAVATKTDNEVNISTCSPSQFYSCSYSCSYHYHDFCHYSHCFHHCRYSHQRLIVVHHVNYRFVYQQLQVLNWVLQSHSTS